MAMLAGKRLPLRLLCNGLRPSRSQQRTVTDMSPSSSSALPAGFATRLRDPTQDRTRPQAVADASPSSGRALPARLAARLGEYLGSLEDRTMPAARPPSPEELRTALADEGIPMSLLGEQGAESPAALERAVELLLEYSIRTGHPLFLDRLFARGSPVSIAADRVLSATSTKRHVHEVAPVYTVMENELLAKIASIVGGEFAEQHDGLFVPSGSLANLYGMHLARSVADPDVTARGKSGGPRLVAFTSDQSKRLLGIGSNNLISVKSDARGRMIPEEFERAVVKAKEDGGLPFFLGASAGTTVIGAFDPFDELADVCRRHGMWMHVDGCWGGSALLSERHHHNMRGIERADSLAWNPHKMSGSAVQTSAFLTRHRGILARNNGRNAAHLFQPDKLNASLDSADKTIQCSMKTDMFKLWFQWKAHGDAGMRATVDHCFDLAGSMARRIRTDATGGWRLVYEPSCTNVCFWYVPERLRPFDFETATEEQAAELHKVAPLIKNEMLRAGDAMIGFQSVNGRPNFFRMVFAAADIVTEGDIQALMQRMARIGEEQYGRVAGARA